LFLFAESFGQSEFLLNLVSEQVYDPKTGIFKSNIHNMTVQNLFSLDFDFELVGLTEEFMAKLYTIPFDDYFALLGTPGLDNFGLGSFVITYQDNSFFQKFVNFFSKSTKRSEKSTIVELSEAIAKMTKNTKPLINKDEVERAFNLFLSEPKTLSVGLSPDTPFTYRNVKESLADLMAIANALKFFVAANSSPPVIMKFADTGPTIDDSDDIILEEDIFIEEED
jgi:hypothetical protein